ncbi:MULTISPECIES: helix-turn-helix transcriptional regulator [unclassified Bacteroides]|uniref:helix-turn-helix transcriptional regulator n=1 Tax=unclassified Bacteroides TaxID=2646097 RepID=UPI0013EB891D|nr:MULTISPECIES: helix-turn-helix transcriptional regulator [unclassified Bacteroides]QTO26236.1 helix-turn-helix transcriptional regulator [Bacteroides sp. ZJ-18]
MIMMNFCIGILIQKKLEESGMSKKELAKRINCSRGRIYNILGSSTIDLDTLFAVSKALKYDFFSDILEAYSREYREM